MDISISREKKIMIRYLKEDTSGGSPIKIFLTNVGKYAEGELVGTWVNLPVDDNFESAKKEIGINGQYEEWFITDYEAPFEIGEYDDIYELNELAETVQNMDENEQEVLDCLSRENGYDAKEAIEIIENGDYTIYQDCVDMGEVAFQYLNEIGMIDELPEWAQDYFDYDQYGVSLETGGAFYYSKKLMGYIEVYH